MKKTKNYLQKTPHMTLRNYIQISLRKGKKDLLGLWVFSAKILAGITAYTLENFKSNILFNNGSILEIHDDFRTRGNASFNNLSQTVKEKKLKIYLKKINIITLPKTNLCLRLQWKIA